MQTRAPLTLLLCVLALAACGDDPKPDPQPGTPGASDPAAADPAPIDGNDVATTDDGSDANAGTATDPGAEPVAPPKPGDAPVAPDAASGTDDSAKTDEPVADANGRKATKEGDAAVRKHAKLVQLPTTGVKTFKAVLRSSNPMYGDGIGAEPEWTAEKGLRLNITFSDALKEQIPEQQRPMIVQMVDNQFKPYLMTLFEPIDKGLANYDVKHKKTDQGLRVDLFPNTAEGIQWENLKLYVDERGLVTRMIGVRHFDDPDDPQVAMLAGTEEEYVFEYLERGEGFVIQSIDVATMAAQGKLAIQYHETKTTAALPKEITIESPALPAPVQVWMNDFVIDGKDITSTKWVPPKKDEPKVPDAVDPPKAPDTPDAPDTPK